MFGIPVTSWVAAPSLAEESQRVNLYMENINREWVIGSASAVVVLSTPNFMVQKLNGAQDR